MYYADFLKKTVTLIIKTLKNIGVKEFEMLFKEYYSDLCNFALKFTKNRDASEEVVQEVFYKIWEKRSFISIKISIKSYLYISVRNKCLQQISHKKIVRLYEKHIEKQKISSPVNPYENLIYSETVEIFTEALNSLPERCSKIFKFSRFDGLKYKEISEELKVSVKTVEANISKALKTLRIYFPEYAQK